MEIAYIIPLHKKDKKVFRAINSVPKDHHIVVSCSKNVFDWLIEQETAKNVTLVSGKASSSFPYLVNLGIKHIKETFTTKFDFISILEYDDEVTPTSNEILEQYATDENVGIYAPFATVHDIVKQEKEEIDVLIGIMNEACYAGGIPEEPGYFDYNMLIRVNLLFMNGCYIRPSVFESVGVLKKNFKYFTDYEWALRASYNGITIKGIPKACRKHYINKDKDGAFNMLNDLPKEKAEEYLTAARTEYYFDEDRPLDIN